MDHHDFLVKLCTHHRIADFLVTISVLAIYLEKQKWQPEE